MARRKQRPPARKRVGRVSYYEHHGGWFVYYRDGARQIRRRVASTESEAERVAAQINAQLAAAAPTLLAFTPVSTSELRREFLDHHEQVLRSSLATVRRYRAATLRLEHFAREHAPNRQAHELHAPAFVAYLRGLLVAPNGHPNARRRALRDKGARYILQCCRSLYAFAQRRQHLPPYAVNPFAELRLDRQKIEDAKPIFVFDSESEHAFLRMADDWAFPLHLTLAKTGMRSGELVHLLIEEVDLDRGWLHVRGKPSLGWRVKTGRDRDIPLIDELVAVMRRVIGARRAGLVFVRLRYHGPDRPVAGLGLHGLLRVYRQRLDEQTEVAGRSLSRVEQARIARGVWRDAGLVKVDAVRSSFVRVTKTIGWPDATCPKSWRHSFATLLQDAGVDPLIRQLTLGHRPAAPAAGALGMTSVYTHTRPETHRAEIRRALKLWPRSLQLARSWAQGGA
jgi:integrase